MVEEKKVIEVEDVAELKPCINCGGTRNYYDDDPAGLRICCAECNWYVVIPGSAGSLAQKKDIAKMWNWLWDAKEDGDRLDFVIKRYLQFVTDISNGIHDRDDIDRERAEARGDS